MRHWTYDKTEGVRWECSKRGLIKPDTKTKEEKIEVNKNPICPICMSELQKTNYKGYYDSFSCWICDCEEFVDGKTLYGCYG